MIKRPSLRYPLTRLTAMLGCATYPASAQTTASQASAGHETEAVKLSVFEMKTTRDEGYQSHSTLWGTRRGKLLFNIPVS